MSRNKSIDNNWNEYEKLVLSKLDSHDKTLSDVLKQMQAQNTQLSDFKVEVAKALVAHQMSCRVVEELPKVSRDIAGIKASIENIRKSEKTIEENTKDISKLNGEVIKLQVKSGLWGAIGGVVSLATVILAIFLEEKIPALAKFLINLRGG